MGGCATHPRIHTEVPDYIKRLQEVPASDGNVMPEHTPLPPTAPRFLPALGSDDLRALILQYAMYKREAQEKLTADPALGLAHFYEQPHKKNFIREPSGVEVMGAGYTNVNGWYRRRENAEGPPSGDRAESWI